MTVLFETPRLGGYLFFQQANCRSRASSPRREDDARGPASLFECSMSLLIAGEDLASLITADPDNDASKIADHIKRAAISSFGVAGPEFVRRLLKQDTSTLARDLRAVVDEFVRTHIPTGSDGQVIRAAQRFGLIWRGR